MHAPWLIQRTSLWVTIRSSIQTPLSVSIDRSVDVEDIEFLLVIISQTFAIIRMKHT